MFPSSNKHRLGAGLGLDNCPSSKRERLPLSGSVQSVTMARSLSRPTSAYGTLLHSIRLRCTYVPWKGIGDDGDEAPSCLSVPALCYRSGHQLNDSRSNVANRDHGQRATRAEVRSYLTPSQAAVMLHVELPLSGLEYRLVSRAE